MKPEMRTTPTATHPGRAECFPRIPAGWVTNDFRVRNLSVTPVTAPTLERPRQNAASAEVGGQLDLLWRKALRLVPTAARRPLLPWFWFCITITSTRDTHRRWRGHAHTSDEIVCRRADKWKKTAHWSDLIKLFMLGTTHGEILCLLSMVDDSLISTCTTQRILSHWTVEEEEAVRPSGRSILSHWSAGRCHGHEPHHVSCTQLITFLRKMHQVFTVELTVTLSWNVSHS